MVYAIIEPQQDHTVVKELWQPVVVYQHTGEKIMNKWHNQTIIKAIFRLKTEILMILKLIIKVKQI
jgi:hypothetical protein